MKKDILDFNGNIISNEFYYDIIDTSNNNPIPLEIFNGLNKIYDFNDKQFNDIQKAVKNTTDDQNRMLAFVDAILDKELPNNKIVAIFTNFHFNKDGEVNIIDEIAMIYNISPTQYMLLRLADYSLTDFAKQFDISLLSDN